MTALARVCIGGPRGALESLGSATGIYWPTLNLVDIVFGSYTGRTDAVPRVWSLLAQSLSLGAY